MRPETFRSSNAGRSLVSADEQHLSAKLFKDERTRALHPRDEDDLQIMPKAICSIKPLRSRLRTEQRPDWVIIPIAASSTFCKKVNQLS